MKFRVKITLCMLGMLAVLFGIGGSLLISSTFHATLRREQETAYNAYRIVLGTLQMINRRETPSDYTDISSVLEQFSKQNADSWTALRLYSAAEPVYEYGTFRFPVTDVPVLPGNCQIRTASSGQAHTMLLSGSLEAGEEILYLDMARDITPLYTVRQTQQQAYQIIFLFMSVLCALLSYSFSRMLTAPLVELSKATRAIANGELSCRAKVRSEDEVGLVTRDFNAMAETLEKNITEIQESMERQERFMGSFSHELKTPMTSIIGYADLIRGQTLSADEQAEAANFIVKEGKRLENLSQKLLNILLLKKTDTAFVRVRPAALILSLAAHMEPVYAKQGVSLCCECGEGECLLEPDLVKSLLINLWDNARKAMDDRDGGRIDVRSEMLPDGCQILVRDNGRGIPPQALAHLTEAFYRVDKSRSREQGGVGLGLSLCQEIVSLHHGNIRFESRPGAGTDVFVELRGGAV